MLINVFHDSPGEHRRLALAGIASIVTIALLIALSIAIYDKKFTKTTDVTVMADRAGLQLARFGDVRLHGALVGYVEKIESDGEHAKIRLALKPSAASKIPDNVSARILPTTLFGQNFVELVPQKGGSLASPLRDGTVIPANRVTTNTELQSILADLFPLLRSIRPGDLNATLYALAHALQGKGDQLGETFVELDDYLNRVNVHLPTLRTDLQLLSDVSKTYDMAAPDLIKVLRNATVTARTISTKETQFQGALNSLTGLAQTTTVTLEENEKRLISQVQTARPLLKLLDTYSPSIPCMLSGLDHQIPNSKNVFQNKIIHQTMELGAPQRTPYTEADKPVYGEVGHGPWCLGLPDDYPIPAPYVPLKDGSNRDDPDGGIK